MQELRDDLWTTINLQKKAILNDSQKFYEVHMKKFDPPPPSKNDVKTKELFTLIKILIDDLLHAMTLRLNPKNISVWQQ